MDVYIVVGAVLFLSGLFLGYLVCTRQRRIPLPEPLSSPMHRQAILLASLKDALIGVNKDYVITDWNQGAENLYGYRADEAIGKPMGELLQTETLDAFSDFEQALNSDNVYRGSASRISKAGKKLYVESTVSRLTDENGRTVGYVGIDRDITERKHAEHQLRESEERFRALIEDGQDMISIVGADGVIRYTAPSSKRILGYEPKDLIGKQCFDLVHPEDQTAAQSILRQAADAIEGTCVATEMRIKHSDGSWRCLEIVMKNAFDRPGIRGIITNVYDVTAHKRKEEALGDAVEKLRALIQSAPLAIVALDLDGNVTLWNPAAERLFGWKDVEITGRSNPIVPDDKQGESLTANNRVLNSEFFEQAEVTRQRRDGSLVDVSLSTALLWDADGRIAGTIAMMADITAQKQVHRKLLQQNEYLAALHETSVALNHPLSYDDLLEAIITRAGDLLNTPDGYLYMVDPLTNELVMRVGVGFYRNYLGYRVGYGKGLSGRVLESGQARAIDCYAEWPGRLPDADFDRLHSLVGIPLKSGEAIIGVLGLARFKQDWSFTAEEMALLEQFAELASIILNNANLYSSAQKELAERKHAEEELLRLNAELEQHVQRRTAELQQRQAELRAVLDAMGEGVMYSEGFHIRYINQAMAELTGYRVEELIGQPNAIFRSDRAAEEEAKRFNEPFAEPGVTWRGESRWRRKDGSDFDAALTVRLMEKIPVPPGGAVTVVRDITAEKQLQTQKAEFIANASHELRTPLTNFKTRLYLIRRQPERLDEHLIVLERVTERMASLVEDLLDVSRFERGVIPLFREDVVLQPLISEVTQTQQPEAERKHLSLTTDFPTAPLHVFADPNRLTQVIVNLIINAINYTPPKGYVRIRLFAENEWAVIQVQDTGIGIRSENLHRVFEPFFRANEGTARGTGLGLSISREIVHLHGGTLTVESAPGKGSTFSVRLPLSTTIPEQGSITSMS